MINMRKLAEKTASGFLTSVSAQRAQVFATLDLADAIREAGRGLADSIEVAGEKVATSLADIEAGVTQLAVAIADLDLVRRLD